MKAQDIRVFQIHYKPEQLASLDPAFVPFDNAGVNDPFLEFGVFKRLHASPSVDGAALWGAFSWKFGQKTGMTGAELFDQIESEPGFDLYYSNYSPEIEALFQNLWMHGQTTHPGFIKLVQAVFRKAGLNPALCFQIDGVSAFATANFFVATPSFWQGYIAFVDSVMQPALADPVLREQLLSGMADPKAIHVGACYVPFVVERLFGVYLQTEEGRRFKSKKYSVPAMEARLTPHHHLLRQMKEVAWSTRSPWLMNCWYGYRNLYLESKRGEAWAREHLHDITPAQLIFTDKIPE